MDWSWKLIQIGIYDHSQYLNRGLKFLFSFCQHSYEWEFVYFEALFVMKFIC